LPNADPNVDPDPKPELPALPNVDEPKELGAPKLPKPDEDAVGLGSVALAAAPGFGASHEIQAVAVVLLSNKHEGHCQVSLDLRAANALTAGAAGAGAGAAGAAERLGTSHEMQALASLLLSSKHEAHCHVSLDLRAANALTTGAAGAAVDFVSVLASLWVVEAAPAKKLKAGVGSTGLCLRLAFIIFRFLSSLSDARWNPVLTAPEDESTSS
jgi:hypothetical protein